MTWLSTVTSIKKNAGFMLVLLVQTSQLSEIMQVLIVTFTMSAALYTVEFSKLTKRLREPKILHVCNGLL